MERFYTTKVVKIGSSKGIIIPREILTALMWDRGDVVSFGVIAGPTLVVRQLTDLEIRRLRPTQEITY